MTWICITLEDWLLLKEILTCLVLSQLAVILGFYIKELWWY